MVDDCIEHFPKLEPFESFEESSGIQRRRGGDVTLSVQPHPDLAIDAVGASNMSPVRILFEGAGRDTTLAFQHAAAHRTSNFDAGRLQLRVVATSTNGRVMIVSMPAAPLAPAPIGQAQPVVRD